MLIGKKLGIIIMERWIFMIFDFLTGKFHLLKNLFLIFRLFFYYILFGFYFTFYFFFFGSPLTPISQAKGLVGNRGGGCTEQPMSRELGPWLKHQATQVHSIVTLNCTLQ